MLLSNKFNELWYRLLNVDYRLGLLSFRVASPDRWGQSQLAQGEKGFCGWSRNGSAMVRKRFGFGQDA